ncbi:hypothetical protein D3C79_826500 [compost metagenome]
MLHRAGHTGAQVLGQPGHAPRRQQVSSNHGGMAAITRGTKIRLQRLQAEQNRLYAAAFQLADQLLAQAAELMSGGTLLALPLTALEPSQALVIDKHPAVAEAQLLQGGHTLYEPRRSRADRLSDLAHRQPRSGSRGQKTAANPEGACRHTLFDPLQQPRVNHRAGDSVFVGPCYIQRNRHQFRTVAALPGLGCCLEVRPQAKTT